jgi:hypothetical protein
MEKSFRNKGFVMDNIDEGTIMLTGFEHCIINVVESIHGRHVVYDKNKIIQTIMADSDMDIFMAYEYFDFNIIGGFYGDCTPLFDIKTELEI